MQKTKDGKSRKRTKCLYRLWGAEVANISLLGVSSIASSVLSRLEGVRGG